MCEGGRLLADFVAGTATRPVAPQEVSEALVQTTDGAWVVWAHKLAHRRRGMYQPLSHGEPYPLDAVAECSRGGAHRAPDPRCTCGFHALSSPWPRLARARGLAELEVVLSGRVLAFDWPAGGLLFRAERQTVVRASEIGTSPVTPPDDPDGRLVPRRRALPRGSGPLRLRLPAGPPAAVAVTDDAGFCFLGTDTPVPSLVPV